MCDISVHISYDKSGRIESAYLTLSRDQFTVFVSKKKFHRDKVGYDTLRSKMLPANINESEVGGSSMNVGSIVRIQKGVSTLKFEMAQ